LRRCLASLLELCRLYGYGGMQDGYYRKVSVMIADDTQDADLIAANQAVIREFDAQGLAIRHFGLAEQLALLDSLAGVADLDTIVGNAPRDAFGHKGQAMMRNIAYLELARLQETDAPLLFYTLDADQQFKVKVETANGDGNVSAVNFFAQLDAIFSTTDADVLTARSSAPRPFPPPSWLATSSTTSPASCVKWRQATRRKLTVRTRRTRPVPTPRITTWLACSASRTRPMPIATAACSTVCRATLPALQTSHSG
jgi:hypothetical protein